MDFLFSKKIIAGLAITTILATALFSLAMMVHPVEGGLMGDCPLVVGGDLACAGGLLSAAVHHIAAYHNFFNIVIVLVLLALAVLAGLFYLPPSGASLHTSGPPAVFPFQSKLTRWLALLELSPAF